MSLIKVTNENFNELINSENTTLVDFYADWCGPCRMLGPVIEEIANENKNINVGKVNVDSYKELANQFGIRSIPTMIVFKNGKEIKRLVGFLPKDEILNRLA
jgi:thioredoxin 1